MTTSPDILIRRDSGALVAPTVLDPTAEPTFGFRGQGPGRQSAKLDVVVPRDLYAFMASLGGILTRIHLPRIDLSEVSKTTAVGFDMVGPQANEAWSWAEGAIRRFNGVSPTSPARVMEIHRNSSFQTKPERPKNAGWHLHVETPLISARGPDRKGLILELEFREDAGPRTWRRVGRVALDSAASTHPGAFPIAAPGGAIQPKEVASSTTRLIATGKLLESFDYVVGLKAGEYRVLPNDATLRVVDSKMIPSLNPLKMADVVLINLPPLTGAGRDGVEQYRKKRVWLGPQLPASSDPGIVAAAIASQGSFWGLFTHADPHKDGEA